MDYSLRHPQVPRTKRRGSLLYRAAGPTAAECFITSTGRHLHLGEVEAAGEEAADEEEAAGEEEVQPSSVVRCFRMA